MTDEYQAFMHLRTYILTVKHSPRSWEALIKSADPHYRTEALMEVAKQLGGQLIHAYFTLGGDVDQTIIVELPGPVEVNVLLATMKATGYYKTIHAAHAMEHFEFLDTTRRAGELAGGLLLPGE